MNKVGLIYGVRNGSACNKLALLITAPKQKKKKKKETTNKRKRLSSDCVGIRERLAGRKFTPRETDSLLRLTIVSLVFVGCFLFLGRCSSALAALTGGVCYRKFEKV